MDLRIQQEPFDPGAESNSFMAGESSAGAVVTFTGLVRSDPGNPLAALTLECYPELAETQIRQILAEATRRFGLHKVCVIHRYGRLQPGEPIVQVMTLSAHRQAAFDGAMFLMDYLKTDAPFWKKEETASGARWVDTRQEDDAARNRWRRDD